MRKIIYEYNHLLWTYKKICRKLLSLRSSNRNERRQLILQKHISRLNKKLSVLSASIRLTTAAATAVVGSFVFAPSANAQINFGPKQINPFNITSLNYQTSPSFADIDGDGDLDMITGDYEYSYVGYYTYTYENRFKYYENIGTNSNPNFAAPVINPFGMTGNTNNWNEHFAPTFVDIDGDGDFDLVYGDRFANFFYMENTGTPTAPAFGMPQQNPFGLTQIPGGYYGFSRRSTPSFIDLDGDGDLDLISGNNSGDFFYFENTGTSTSPAFSAAATNPFNLSSVGYYSYSAPTLVDIDGDGDFDLLSGQSDGNLYFFENIGTPLAPDFSASQFNPFDLSIVGSVSYNIYSRPTFADLDNDGDFDIMAGDRNGEFTYFRRCAPSSASINVTSACGYFAPSGQFFATNGTYTDIIPNADGCDSTITINLTIVPIQEQTVTAANPILCSAGSTTIDLGSSQTGVSYFLRDDSNNSIVAGPIVGDGSAISFPTGTISSAITYNVYAEKAIPSTGLVFDGNDDVVNISGINLANNSFSVEFWAKRDGINSQDHIVAQGIANSNQGLHIGFRGSNNFTFAFFGNDLNTTNTFTDNNWHHFAVTYNATTGERIIYVDGSLEISDNTASQYTGTGNIILGDTPWGSDEFGGSVDELRFWSTVRTQTEIADNMNVCLTGTETGLTAYYQFEDGTGSSTLADLTANNHDGSLSGFNVNSAWVAGVTVCATCDLELAQTASVSIQSPINTSTTLSGFTISADLNGATYQWVDCNNGNADISGATNQSYTATANGSYAVEITVNGCTETSNCVAITTVGLPENGAMSSIMVYPNPSTDKFIMITKQSGQAYRVTDNMGKVVTQGVTNNTQTEIDLSAFAKGFYLLTIDAQVIKLIKQ